MGRRGRRGHWREPEGIGRSFSMRGRSSAGYNACLSRRRLRGSSPVHSRQVFDSKPFLLSKSPLLDYFRYADFPLLIAGGGVRLSPQGLWHGPNRLEEGQFAGGAEKLWQACLVPMSIRAFELHRHEILPVNPVFTEQDGIRVFGATQRGCANECFFHLHRFENFVEQRHELICPPRLEWNVYQQGERLARHLASSLGEKVTAQRQKYPLS